MREIATDALAESLVVCFEIAAMTFLTVLGALAERAGITHLQSGIDPLTLWFLVVGGVALYAGVYMLGFRTLLPRLVDRVASADA